MARIHFIEREEKSPTLRCRLFGHKWKVGTYSEIDDGDFVEYAGIAQVCMRCMMMKNGNWEDVHSWSPSSGYD